MSNQSTKRPVAAPAAATAGLLLALAVIALGVAGVQHASSSAGWISESSWLDWIAGKAEVLRPADWMMYAGIPAALIGIWLIATALTPRRATHLAVGDADVWIRPGDLARLAADTARATSEVSSASSKSNRRTVKLTATAVTPDTAQLTQSLDTAIATRLQPVRPSPRIRVHVTPEEL
ncbi:DUF6286 domain-containing protein [Kribbella italica]|uniref:DUF6286 domain-containing protein n=1 Tax=Kribbella italica TaxID=1540520 RepID=A0A7W9JEU6_9ACTN|nr:hypothetical protein [Kribbella italica]